MTYASIEGNWILKSGVEVKLLPDTKITAEFKDGKLSGNGGCNQYFAGYTVKPGDKISGKIQIGEIGSTRMGLRHSDNLMQTKPSDTVTSQQQHHSDLKKIAIIGCGYVGTALARYWYQQQGYSVTATTTRQERVTELEEVATQVVVMKGQDSQAMRLLIENHDTVVLSIAPISDRQVDAEAYRETYIPTAKNLVAALKETPSVKQVIDLSSCSVYGNQKGEWVDEASSVDTNSEHNQVLCETEKLLLDSAHEDVKVSILRLGGIYGLKREITKCFARIAGKTIPGSGDTFTSWIHLDDIIAAVDFLCQRKLGGIYNLVNDFNLTIRELSDKVCASEGLEKILWDDTKASYRSLNARVSNQKIKAAGYKLIHPDTIV